MILSRGHSSNNGLLYFNFHSYCVLGNTVSIQYFWNVKLWHLQLTQVLCVVRIRFLRTNFLHASSSVQLTYCQNHLLPTPFIQPIVQLRSSRDIKVRFVVSRRNWHLFIVSNFQLRLFSKALGTWIIAIIFFDTISLLMYCLVCPVDKRYLCEETDNNNTNPHWIIKESNDMYCLPIDIISLNCHACCAPYRQFLHLSFCNIHCHTCMI